MEKEDAKERKRHENSGRDLRNSGRDLISPLGGGATYLSARQNLRIAESGSLGGGSTRIGHQDRRDNQPQSRQVSNRSRGVRRSGAVRAHNSCAGAGLLPQSRLHRREKKLAWLRVYGLSWSTCHKGVGSQIPNSACLIGRAVVKKGLRRDTARRIGQAGASPRHRLSNWTGGIPVVLS